jgi:hypothetical protein
MASKLMDRLKKKRAELKNKSGGFAYFMIKEGKTRMRALPVGEEKDWAQEVVFFWLGREVGGIISPATFEGKCPVMRLYQKLSKSSDPDDRELAKKFKPSKKFLVPHIKYKDDKGKEVDTENNEKLLILTGGQYQSLLDLYLDEEQGDFTDPVNGYDIRYIREGKGKMDTEYSLVPMRPSKLPKPFSKKLYDPVEMTKKIILPYDELKQKLDEFISGAALEDDDDAPPARRSSKSKDKKKKKNREI